MIPKDKIESDNKKWVVQASRSAFKGHLSGSLVDRKKDRRFIWTSVNGTIHYLQEPRTPKDIPNYVQDIVKGLVNDSGIGDD